MPPDFAELLEALREDARGMPPLRAYARAPHEGGVDHAGMAGARRGARAVDAARRRRERRPFASLNLGAHVGDAPAAVAENRRRLRSAAGLPAEPAWLTQVHGTVIAGPGYGA